MPTSSVGVGDIQGRVQWIRPAPKNNRTATKTTTINNQTTQNRFRYDSQSSNQSAIETTTHTTLNNQQPGLSINVANRDFIVLDPNDSIHQQQHQQEQVSMDDAICKTVCNIVEEYLKELQDHQRHINEARSRLARDLARETDDSNFIMHNDIYRLKVRDEQTKAIETIKQLTNYLRELSHLKGQLDASSDVANENINIRFSDVRNDIIQALNDFVISNDDIDIPILCPGDPNVRDYDLCTDVHRSTSDFSELEVLGSSSANQHSSSSMASTASQASKMSLVKSTVNTRKQPIVLISIDEKEEGTKRYRPGEQQQQQQVQLDSQEDKSGELERRKRDIQKLEKDTIELRRLFADFYNLVKVQGDQVDSIEDNLMIAAQHIGEGKQHLSKSMRGMTILVPVTGCITGALIGGPIGLVIGSKLGGITIVCATSLLGLLSSIGAHRCMAGGKLVRHD